MWRQAYATPPRAVVVFVAAGDPGAASQKCGSILKINKFFNGALVGATGTGD
jgi:hypothetical protein